MNYNELGEYYLDINLVARLNDADKGSIHGYYERLMEGLDLVPNPTGPISASRRSYFLTLSKGGYLKNAVVEDRELKLNNVLRKSKEDHEV